MRFEKGHKAATRQRIVEIASERFRKDGLEAVGIAGLMADAGLTHGGFYAHFGSKEELVREAMQAALSTTKARLDRSAQRDGAGLEGIIRNYLRPGHRDTPEQGCAAAALVAEIARHEPATREVFSEKLEETLAKIAEYLPSSIKVEARQATAMGIFSVMIGALQLARAVVDKKFSGGILESGIQAALCLARVD